jgi:hypothetical protein
MSYRRNAAVTSHGDTQTSMAATRCRTIDILDLEALSVSSILSGAYSAVVNMSYE